MPYPAQFWYVCQSKPRQEAKAVLKLSEQGYEVYLPMLARRERKKNEWIRKEQVMFPRYCFVRCGDAEQSIAPIRSTPGVLGLVRFGHEIATISTTLVDAIRELAEQSEQALREKPVPYPVGTRVAVAEGPLKGLSGLVSAVADERVAILLTLLGREQPVMIPVEQLATA